VDSRRVHWRLPIGWSARVEIIVPLVLVATLQYARLDRTQAEHETAIRRLSILCRLVGFLIQAVPERMIGRHPRAGLRGHRRAVWTFRCFDGRGGVVGELRDHQHQ